MNVFCEKYYPYVISFVVTVILVFSDLLVSLQVSNEVVIVTINIVSILTGFLATMLSILATIAHSKIIQLIRKQNALYLLYRYFREVIFVGFISIFFSLLALTYSVFTYEILFSLWIFATICFFLSVFRVINFMLQIIEKTTDELY